MPPFHRQLFGPSRPAIDLLPALTSLAGVTSKSVKPLDGANLAPVILAKNSAWPDRMIFSLQGERSNVGFEMANGNGPAAIGGTAP